MNFEELFNSLGTNRLEFDQVFIHPFDFTNLYTVDDDETTRKIIRVVHTQASNHYKAFRCSTVKAIRIPQFPNEVLFAMLCPGSCDTHCSGGGGWTDVFRDVFQGYLQATSCSTASQL
jgi:hypothetical protein